MKQQKVHYVAGQTTAECSYDELRCVSTGRNTEEQLQECTGGSMETQVLQSCTGAFCGHSRGHKGTQGTLKETQGCKVALWKQWSARAKIGDTEAHCRHRSALGNTGVQGALGDTGGTENTKGRRLARGTSMGLQVRNWLKLSLLMHCSNANPQVALLLIPEPVWRAVF